MLKRDLSIDTKIPFLMKLNSKNKLTHNYSTFFDVCGGEKVSPPANE